MIFLRFHDCFNKASSKQTSSAWCFCLSPRPFGFKKHIARIVLFNPEDLWYPNKHRRICVFKTPDGVSLVPRELCKPNGVFVCFPNDVFAGPQKLFWVARLSGARADGRAGAPKQKTRISHPHSRIHCSGHRRTVRSVLRFSCAC